MEKAIREAEKEWHEAHYELKRGQDLVVPEAIRKRYLHPRRRAQFHLEHVYHELGDLRGKRVLYYGCGADNSTVLLALKGAEVFAFDLSEHAIRLQRAMAAANGVASRVHVLVSAAEELPFSAGAFDIVVGIAILHHIPDHLSSTPGELASILRPGGRAIFAEPVIRNRFLGWFLRLLPLHDATSPGERQLTDADLEHFETDFRSRRVFFSVLSRLDRFICKGPLETAPAACRLLVQAVHALDGMILRLPFADRLAAIAVLDLRRKS